MLDWMDWIPLILLAVGYLVMKGRMGKEWEGESMWRDVESHVERSRLGDGI